MAGRQVLAQLGQADIILSGEPEITFFKEKYAAQGPYASRIIDITFENIPEYGTDVRTVLPLDGDLMTAMFARFDLPPNLSTDFLPQAGLLMINFVELYSGTQLLERLWGEYLSILNGCQVPTSQQSGLTAITGQNVPGAVYIPAARYTVPLPFTCLSSGLPVAKDLSIRVVLNSSAVFTSPSIVSTLGMQFHLLTEYVVLSEKERAWIQKRGPTVYLCESVQRAEYTVAQTTSNVRCVTNFLHPVKELFFTVKNQVSAVGYDYWYDYSNSSIPWPCMSTRRSGSIRRGARTCTWARPSLWIITHASQSDRSICTRSPWTLKVLGPRGPSISDDSRINILISF